MSQVGSTVLCKTHARTSDAGKRHGPQAICIDSEEDGQCLAASAVLGRSLSKEPLQPQPKRKRKRNQNAPQIAKAGLGFRV